MNEILNVSYILIRKYTLLNMLRTKIRTYNQCVGYIVSFVLTCTTDWQLNTVTRSFNIKFVDTKIYFCNYLNITKNVLLYNYSNFMSIPFIFNLTIIYKVIILSDCLWLLNLKCIRYWWIVSYWVINWLCNFELASTLTLFL